MPAIARLIGGAGTGKTTELMRLLDAVMAKGIDPMQIGFVSFTRAARREASSRAAELIGGSISSLEEDGWFRTLHSICYRCLGETKARILADDRATAKWLKENVGEAASVAIGGEAMDDEDGDAADFEAATDVGKALAIWHAARNRLEPLDDAYRRVENVSDELPMYAAVVEVIEAYEQAKRLDDRCDFTDLLGRFAGWSFGINGHERTTPEGGLPNLPVWFFDEQQDTSALLDAVCHRLIQPASWVYVVGDPMQAIYGWAGADANHFLAWNAQQRIMPKSYRCPAPIHALGESILSDASDYWDRGIAPADHEGVVDVERFGPELLAEIDPTESWLLLARTNYHAARISSRMKDMGIPWAPTRGNGGWLRPKRNVVLNALYDAQSGYPISGDEWGQCVDLLPSKFNDEVLLQRGTKTKWDAKQRKAMERDGRYAKNLDEWGATPALVAAIESGRWQGLIDGAAAYADARDRWGLDAVMDPKVRIGTIHSAKGAEADNVIWLTTTTSAVTRACEDQQGLNEECRVAYVAATRARRRLTIAVELNQRHRWSVSV